MISLRDRLFAAVAAGDDEGFRQLCLDHRDAIRDQYAAWLKPGPDFFQSDPGRVEAYGNGLVAVADFFVHCWNDDTLLRLMNPQGKPRS